MPELETVAIHNPKNAGEKWFINRIDYNPARDRLWSDPVPEEAVETPPVFEATETDEDEYEDVSVNDGSDVAEEPNVEEPNVEEPNVEEHRQLRPSVEDFVINHATGEVVAVNVIDPERRTSRLEIPIEEYDADIHELWSTHPRFNR